MESIIGVAPYEKNTRQTIVLSIEVSFVKKELPTGFIDYECLLSAVRMFVENNVFDLMEDLAQGLSQNLFATFNIRRTCITIEKKATLQRVGAHVGVHICRHRPRSATHPKI